MRVSAVRCLTFCAEAIAAIALFLAVPSPTRAEPVWSSLPYTSFRDMQAVDSSGNGAWSVPTSGPLDGAK
jgi:hypothetical protein